jgi:ABC-type antimicrobial peptide transport system permease subunit
MGVAIGVLIGWSMSLQRAVVTQVPIMFVFPWDVFGLMFAGSIACSILATVFPLIRIFSRKTIVSLLR